MGLDEKDIESVTLPVDCSHFKYLKGWAIVKLTSQENYSKWETQVIKAEGRQIIIHNKEELLEYAISKSFEGCIKEETLQLANHIHSLYNSDSGENSDSDLLESVNRLYINSHKIASTREAADGLVIHKLKDSDKLLVIHHEGKAKVIHKSQYNIGMNFQGGLIHSEDHAKLTLTKDDFNFWFMHMDWSVLCNKHSSLRASYAKFFSSATETLRETGVGGESIEFAAPIRETKAVLDDLLYSVSKERTSRSREFVDLAVIGVENHLTHRNKHGVNECLKNLDVYKRSEKDVSVHEINKVLNIIYKLDEQCWCRAKFLPTDEETDTLMSSVSRPHSELDRLSTFVGLDKSFHSLSKYGYVYRGDKGMK
jgi:cellobiose-specific phosphotransferase system component IIA